ncbi:hypothetical protein PA25_23130 [Pseudoalteromonas sp. A25]|uniref:DUF2306 domain-containing protein n=1 Tax=Pseudoalteromonas sp. A25 TaxID=116092 RepID=UPI0012A2E889|nr:DUF2306 domain-containing protein [Pseudoalteromonas sp. A25]BBN82328.1 hypothetical protein PA25_23130 [Pseudoalteromonas sp. A25]
MGSTSHNFSMANEKKLNGANGAQPSKKVKVNLADKVIKYSAIFWFLAVMAGQWFFFYYIIKFYGFSVINDNMEIWNRWEVFGSTPHKEGDTAGNVLFFVHVIGAGIVAFGGALQLIPKVRALAPKFHKINGYVYLATVFFLAMSGFYLSWIRGASPDLISEIGTSINGFLILGFAYMTVKTAINKNIASHRKWAIRLFLVSNAQWFLRVGVFSYFITGTTVGGNPAFGDLFFPIWTFGCFLLPLAASQLYFYGAKSKRIDVKMMTALVMLVLTVLMSAGIFGFTPFLLQVMSGDPIVF